MNKLKLGIIREEKMPPDSRVPLIPEQCAYLMNKYPIDIIVQSSTSRCYTDEEYLSCGIPVKKDVSESDILLGVKEVPIEALIKGKTYFFFSHTIKKQPHNKDLIKAVLQKKIRLIDYEVLTSPDNRRLIAFGKFAGMVGAHNGMMTYGWRTGQFDLKRMKDCRDYKEAQSIYLNTDFPPIKIVVTGSGRVASGIIRVLDDMGVEKVSPEEYLQIKYDKPVYTQVSSASYVTHKDGKPFNKLDFYRHPYNYRSIFAPYYRESDIMMNGIYWDNNAPAFFTKADMKKEAFKIKVIADVTCDIAPVASIPSTLFASTIADPIFGYNVETEAIAPPHQDKVVDMMTIDNLPNELPRDASEAFGEQFIANIIEEILDEEISQMLLGATITLNGRLTNKFQYLSDYAGITA